MTVKHKQTVREPTNEIYTFSRQHTSDKPGALLMSADNDFLKHGKYTHKYLFVSIILSSPRLGVYTYKLAENFKKAHV